LKHHTSGGEAQGWRWANGELDLAPRRRDGEVKAGGNLEVVWEGWRVGVLDGLGHAREP